MLGEMGMVGRWAVLSAVAMLALGRPAAAETVEVAVSDDVRPYAVADGKGGVSGPAIDAFDRILAQAGLTPHYTVYTLAGLFAALKDGRAAITASVPTPDRDSYLLYTESGFLDVTLSLFWDDPARAVTSAAAVGDRSVLATAGNDLPIGQFRNVAPNARIIPQASYESALAELHEGKGDYLVGYDLPIRSVIARVGVPVAGSLVLRTNMTHVTIARAVPGAAALRDRLDVAMKALRTADLAARPTVLRLVEEANWPPFTPPGEGRVTSGLSYTLMREVFGRAKVPFWLDTMPQLRVEQVLKDGDADAVTEMSESAERAEFAVFSEPLAAKTGYVYFRRDRLPGFHWADYRDLEGHSICTVLGHNYGDAFDAAAATHHFDLQKVPREEQCFSMLAFGRVDLALSVDVVAAEILKNPQYGTVTRAEKPYMVAPYRIGFSRRSAAAALLPEINRAIDEMRADGTLAQILDRTPG